MDKIRLSKMDKVVFRHIHDDSADMGVLPQEKLLPTLRHLESIGLIEIQMSQGKIRTARMTDYGKKYKIENPKLRNGVSDTKKWVISTIITAILAIVTIVIQIVFK